MSSKRSNLSLQPEGAGTPGGGGQTVLVFDFNLLGTAGPIVGLPVGAGRGTGSTDTDPEPRPTSTRSAPVEFRKTSNKEFRPFNCWADTRHCEERGRDQE